MALGGTATAQAIAAEYASIARSYHRSKDLQRAEVVELFADRLREYDAGVYFTGATEIAAKVGEILRGRGKSGLVMASGTPLDWLPKEFAFDIADGWDVYQLDGAQGVLSGCTVAIAETGSMVLQNAAAQGPRILSLVPDYHLCVVLVSQIVATVPEAFQKLAATSTLPTTFISGPSATADIEMTRIKGVHGPRFLDVLMVG